MSASFYKLKDDTWGIRLKDAEGEPNMSVEVTTKAGETKTVILGNRVAKFDDAELWSLAGKGTVNVSKVKPVEDERAIPAQLPDDPFETAEEPF